MAQKKRFRIHFHPAFTAALDGAAKVLGMNPGIPYDIDSEIEEKDESVRFGICCRYHRIEGLTTGRTKLIVEGIVRMAEGGVPTQVEYTAFFIDTSHAGARFKRLRSFLLKREGMADDYWCLTAMLGNQVSLRAVNGLANS